MGGEAGGDGAAGRVVEDSGWAGLAVGELGSGVWEVNGGGVKEGRGRGRGGGFLRCRRRRRRGGGQRRGGAGAEEGKSGSGGGDERLRKMMLLLFSFFYPATRYEAEGVSTEPYLETPPPLRRSLLRVINYHPNTYVLFFFFC